MESKPTLLTIPCLAGAPWQLAQLHHLHGWRIRTMRLPERLDGLEKLADFVLAPAHDLDSYWSEAKTRHLFMQERPRAYVNRVHAVGGADYTAQLSRISVPTLILTPEDDRLIGKDAAGILLGGIEQSGEVGLSRMDHTFRFSHPGRYSETLHTFLTSSLAAIGVAQ